LEPWEASGEQVAAAGPVFVDTRSGLESKFVRLGISGRINVHCRDKGPEKLKVDLLISSGMLIKTSALREIGMLDELLFIDHVDTEWCLRARARGYRLLGVCTAKMTHRLGDRPAPAVLGRRFFVRSPLRHYFFLRNSLLLYRRPYMPTAWKISDALRLVPLSAAALLFCAPRGRQFKAMVHGFLDGIRGRSGPAPRELEEQLSA
jgi:rhamnosyltransferase